MRHGITSTFIARAGAVLLVSWLSATAAGQEMPGDRLTVPLSDPSRPATVSASLISGGITVQGYDGAEVIVEAQVRRDSERKERNNEKAQGMRRIATGSTGLTVDEENNVVKVNASSHSRSVDLMIQVPVRTSLRIRCVNSGDIIVENVSGEVEANNVNGRITLTGIAGVVVANTVNGEVKAELTSVTPDQPMSFSSLNGDVDVAFPADVRANVKMETENGTIYTDFEIEMRARAEKPIVEEDRESGGKYRVRVDKAAYGAINGGGPEMQFKTFNGSIYIRAR